MALFLSTGAAADQYVVTIDKADIRLAKVSATLFPDDDFLWMNDEGNQGLPLGWATFVEDLQVTDANGNELSLQPEKNSRWRLSEYAGGPLKLTYSVRLKHDQVPLNFGDNGAAYANSFGVMWAGRALFIAGRATRDVSVEFQLPGDWHITTPWEAPGDRKNLFVPRGTDDLMNSAYFAGTHTAFEVTAGSAAIRFALAGSNVLAMKNDLSELTGKYLRYYEKTYGPPPASHMLLIASDASYWGGEVMGRVISLSIAGQPREGFNPLAVMSHVIAHEVFHMWNSTIEVADDLVWQFEWLNEGFGAEYASWLAGWRLGDLDEATFLGQLSEAWSKYVSDRTKNESLVSAGKNKADNEDLIYSGGLIAAATLDFMIRSESKGTKSLDKLWPQLLTTFPAGGEALTMDKLFDVVQSLYGESTARAFKTYVNESHPIPLVDAARRMGLHAALQNDGRQLTLSTATDTTDAQRKLWSNLYSP